jgi:hypothetical protein
MHRQVMQVKTRGIRDWHIAQVSLPHEGPATEIKI